MQVILRHKECFQACPHPSLWFRAGNERMSEGENCACPGRSAKVYNTCAERRHALRVIRPSREAGRGGRCLRMQNLKTGRERNEEGPGRVPAHGFCLTVKQNMKLKCPKCSLLPFVPG